MVYIELSAFFNSPHRTGIQRVCGELCRFWPTSIPVRFVMFQEGRGILPLRISAPSAIRQFFEDVGCGEATIQELVSEALSSETPLEIGAQDRILVPEVVYDPNRIRYYEKLSSLIGNRIYFIVYDLLPITHPEYFSRDLPHERIFLYFRFLRSIQNLAFISDLTKLTFCERFARKARPDAPVFRLGSDGLSKDRSASDSSDRGLFTVVGTIEPRKRQDLILEAFDSLMKEIAYLRLIFCGAIGSGSELSSRVRRYARQNSAFKVQENASDDQIRETMAFSRATIFLSAAEGFGLPPVESLWLGVPVLASKGIPSLESIGDRGVEIVEPATLCSLKRAVIRMLDDSYWQGKREEALQLDLPTWRSFAHSVADWVTG
jgi:glycosyltransferase involved in cell wall biosynthesis